MRIVTDKHGWPILPESILAKYKIALCKLPVVLGVSVCWFHGYASLVSHTIIVYSYTVADMMLLSTVIFRIIAK